MHYMAMCEGSCSTYSSINAEWFKISELGLEPDGITWYQTALSQHLFILCLACAHMGLQALECQ